MGLTMFVPHQYRRLVTPISAYFQAWNEPDVERRRELLARSVTPEVELIHPTFGRSRGIERILLFHGAR
jgi:hypothetical protein